MNLQGASLSMQNNYSSITTGKYVTKNTMHSDNDKKVNNQNGNNISLSQNADFDKLIEKIQEQIQKIHENDYYDEDTKKNKIEELQKQLEEIEKTKVTQLSELKMEEETNPPQ